MISPAIHSRIISPAKTGKKLIIDFVLIFDNCNDADNKSG